MFKKFTKIALLIAICAFIIFKYLLPEYDAYLSSTESIKKYQGMSSIDSPWQIAGYSTLGHPIYEGVFGDSAKTLLIVAGMHGNEYGSFELAFRLFNYLSTNPDEIKSRVVVIPVINPDGLLANSRGNGNNVDLSRNFPSQSWTPVYESDQYYPGTRPLSESESALIIQTIARYKPQKILCLHSDLHANIFYGPGKNLANMIGQINTYPVMHHRVHPVNGSLGEYAGEELNIPAVTIELPAHNPEKVWQDNKAALIAAINY